MKKQIKIKLLVKSNVIKEEEEKNLIFVYDVLDGKAYFEKVRNDVIDFNLNNFDKSVLSSILNLFPKFILLDYAFNSIKVNNQFENITIDLWGRYKDDNIPFKIMAEYTRPIIYQKKVSPNDNVNHPNHYTKGGVECIDCIKAATDNAGYRGFLKGNVMKYVYRYESKEKPLEDLKKARWYLDKLIGELEK